MTASARTVLGECRLARVALRNGIQGSEWLHRWILAVVLLRTVGYVLDKVDGERNEHYRQAITHRWAELNASKPKPEIFWGFIEEERNLILKLFQINAGQGVTIPLRGMAIQLNGPPTTEGVDQPVEAIYSYPITSGHFVGADQGDVIDQAIAWWQAELDGIDEAVVRSGGIKSVGHMAIFGIK